MLIAGDKHPHGDVVVVDFELDHLGSDGAILSPAPSRPFAIGETVSADQTQEPQDEWKPNHPDLRTDFEVFGAFFNPITFRPVKTLDFNKYEIFLKHLGLWGFINLDYDFEIRSDLLQQLVFNFNPTVGLSTVEGMSVEIDRMAIARALKLPVGQVEIDDQLGVDGSELVELVEGIVVNWMILHGNASVVPEALEWMRLIRKGKLDEMDWAGLMWFMVERELLDHVWELGICYYASYLQCLIMFQLPGLFEERAMVEGNGKTEEGLGYEVIKLDDDDGDDDDDDDQQDAVDVNLIYLDDDKQEDVGYVNMVKLYDDDDDDYDHSCRGQNKRDAADYDDSIQELEGQKVSVLELGKIESDEVGGVDVLEPECPLLKERDGSGGHFMQQCHQSKIRDIAFQCEGKADVREEICNISMKCSPAEGLAYGNCVQYIGTENLLLNPSLCNPDHFTKEPLASRTQTSVNVGDPFVSNNSLKRQLENQDENDNLCDSYHKKRTRNDDSSEPNLLEFDFCMEQIRVWMDKARMAYISKEQACRTAKTNEQVLLKALTEKERTIEYLESRKREDIHKREVEVYNLIRELHVMGNLLDGYRSALGKTQQLFSEYRERHQLPEEPLYRDGVSIGGVVLRSSDLQQEEEERVFSRSLTRNTH